MTLKVTTKAGASVTGTAFLAMREGCAITAWHVVKDAETVTARFADGESFEVSGLIDKDEKRDVAIVKVKVADRPLLTIAAKEPEVGAKAYVLGAPQGLEFSLSEGIISQIRLVEGFKQYQYSAPTNPGNSGGPLLSLAGEVLGVVSWKWRDAENLNFAVAGTYAKGLDTSLPTQPWSSVKASVAPVETNDANAVAELVECRIQANMLIQAQWDLKTTVMRVSSGNVVLPLSVYRAVDGLAEVARRLRGLRFASKGLSDIAVEAAECYEAISKGFQEMIDATVYATRNGWDGYANAEIGKGWSKLGRSVGWDKVNTQVQELMPKGLMAKYPEEVSKALFSRDNPWPKTWSLSMQCDLRAAPRLVVADVDPKGVAGKADIRPFDEILEVDGQAIRGWTTFDNILTGSAGKTIKLKVRRLKGEEATLSLKVPRSS